MTSPKKTHLFYCRLTTESTGFLLWPLKGGDSQHLLAQVALVLINTEQSIALHPMHLLQNTETSGIELEDHVAFHSSTSRIL